MSTDPKPKPRKPGTFQPGHPGYKPKGPHKLTKTIKEAMIEAGEKTGSDGNGKDEIVGVFKAVAQKDIVAFGHMLTKVVPTQIESELTVHTIGEVNIVVAPSGMFVTHAQNEHLNRTGQLLPPAEAEAAERKFNGPRAEPEITELLERVTKRKPGDDLA